MEKKTTGIVVSIKKQWWLKVNTKPVRLNPLNGATFPHTIKVEYTVDGQTYRKRKWIGAGCPIPAEGSSVTVLYDDSKPSKSKVI